MDKVSVRSSLPMVLLGSITAKPNRAGAIN